jgi:hypothetical protein
MQVLLVQVERFPSAEGRRASAEVDHHVEDGAAGAPHQLGRAAADLEVHASHDA